MSRSMALDAEIDAARVWHALATGRCQVLFAADEGDRRRVVVVLKQERSTPNWSSLPPRERAILRAAATGAAQKVVALEMGCSRAMVSATLRKLRQELHFETTYALCRAYAVSGEEASGTASTGDGTPRGRGRPTISSGQRD